jgi:hypothetical protein
MQEEKLSEDEKNALLAIHAHLACIRQSGFSHACIVVEQVLVLLELPNVKLYLEGICAALENVVGLIQEERKGAGWRMGVIIRDLERLIANLQHSQAGHAAGQPTAKNE